MSLDIMFRANHSSRDNPETSGPSTGIFHAQSVNTGDYSDVISVGLQKRPKLDTQGNSVKAAVFSSRD